MKSIGLQSGFVNKWLQTPGKTSSGDGVISYGATYDSSNDTTNIYLKRIKNVCAKAAQFVSFAISAIVKTYVKVFKFVINQPTACRRVVLSLLLVLFTLLFILSGWMTFFAAAGLDPCKVAEESKRFIKKTETMSSSPNSSSLPKIIHQQSKTEVIEGDLLKWHKEFKRLFPEPEFKHELWTDERMRSLIASEYPFFLKHYDGYVHPIQRVDSARYFILHQYGGLYADLDIEPLINYWDFLPRDRPAFIESPYAYNEYVQNSLMSSPKGHLFWNYTFELLMERSSRKDVLSTTGPIFCDDAIKKSNHLPVYVLPCENFHRIPTGEGKIYIHIYGTTKHKLN